MGFIYRMETKMKAPFVANKIINTFISLYSIYTFFDIKFFYNNQGSKLHLKKQISQKTEV